MKYKVLLVSKNASLFGDFFAQDDFHFTFYSCTLSKRDIIAHIEGLELDAIIYFMKNDTEQNIDIFTDLRSKLLNHQIAFSVVGDLDDCFNATQKLNNMLDLSLTRPISYESIKQELSTLIDRKRILKEATHEEPDEYVEDLDSLLSSDGYSPNKKHILVVDDDARMLKLVKTYLNGNYDVATALNGKVALKFLETKKTDLILLDYEMPIESGAQVLAKLRANPKTKDLPVIFLTGVSDKEKIREVLSYNPQGYLLKPISRIKLFSAIKSVID